MTCQDCKNKAIDCPCKDHDKEVWLMGYRCGIQEMQDLEKQIINLVNNHEFHGEWRKENTI